MERPRSPIGAVCRIATFCNQRGLHARAAARFVKSAGLFNAEVWVTRGTETVGGTSIMGLMMLAAAPGTTIVVSAIGPDAEVGTDLHLGLQLPFAASARRVAGAFGGIVLIELDAAAAQVLRDQVLHVENAVVADDDFHETDHPASNTDSARSSSSGCP